MRFEKSREERLADFHRQMEAAGDPKPGPLASGCALPSKTALEAASGLVMPVHASPLSAKRHEDRVRRVANALDRIVQLSSDAAPRGAANG